eukprot:9487755-Pyramimonas_sp.AAC.1
MGTRCPVAGPVALTSGRSPIPDGVCQRSGHPLWGKTVSPWPSSLRGPMCPAGGPTRPRIAMNPRGQPILMR